MTEASTSSLDILFVGEHALWPLDQGFCVHGYNTARAMHDLGVRVGIASLEPQPHDAPQTLQQMAIAWPQATDADLKQFMAGWKGFGARGRTRLADYQGRDLQKFAGIIPLVQKYQPKTVIGLGQHSILMLRGLWQHRDLRKVWYAADELIRFQLSCMKNEGFATLRSRLRKLAVYAGLENFFARGLDGAIGVSPTETRLLKYLAGVRQAVTIRNGVDLDYFSPTPAIEPDPHKLVFWGRMDFEPNIDAVCWFSKNIWPDLIKQSPQTCFQIIGKNPTPKVQALDQLPGIQVVGQVDDLRPAVRDAAAVVLPMRCGGGIKNKLLEAAALGLPLICSPKAVQGLVNSQGALPMRICRQPVQWIKSIMQLQTDPNASQSLRIQGRLWVQRHHSWNTAATQFIHWLDQLPDRHGHTVTHLASRPTLITTSTVPCQPSPVSTAA